MNQSYIATLISQSKNTRLHEIAAKTSAKFCEGNIEWLAHDVAVDILLSDECNMEEVHQFLQTLTNENKIDFAIQPVLNRRKKALIADMDSTMIDQECIDELAAEIGLKDKVAAITAKAMNGEIEFESALRERVALLEGLSSSISRQVINNRITLAKGGKTLLATMKKNGAWTALVSGGFTLFTKEIAAMLGFDENHANILEIADGRFTGTVQEPILGADAKVAALNRIAKEQNFTADDFIAVGDGANDLPMLQLAGTGVALHAKPNVAKQAKIKIDHSDLTALLYIQGYKQSEFLDA